MKKDSTVCAAGVAAWWRATRAVAASASWPVRSGDVVVVPRLGTLLTSERPLFGEALLVVLARQEPDGLSSPTTSARPGAPRPTPVFSEHAALDGGLRGTRSTRLAAATEGLRRSDATGAARGWRAQAATGRGPVDESPHAGGPAGVVGSGRSVVTGVSRPLPGEGSALPRRAVGPGSALGDHDGTAAGGHNGTAAGGHNGTAAGGQDVGLPGPHRPRRPDLPVPESQRLRALLGETPTGVRGGPQPAAAPRRGPALGDGSRRGYGAAQRAPAALLAIAAGSRIGGETPASEAQLRRLATNAAATLGAVATAGPTSTAEPAGAPATVRPDGPVGLDHDDGGRPVTSTRTATAAAVRSPREGLPAMDRTTAPTGRRHRPDTGWTADRASHGPLAGPIRTRSPGSASRAGPQAATTAWADTATWADPPGWGDPPGWADPAVEEERLAALADDLRRVLEAETRRFGIT